MVKKPKSRAKPAAKRKKPVSRKAAAKAPARKKAQSGKSPRKSVKTPAKPRKKSTKTARKRKASSPRTSHGGRSSVNRRKPAVRSARRRVSRRRSSRRRARHIPVWLSGVAGFAYRVAALCFIGAIAAIVSLFYFARDLPSISKLETLTRPAQITIVDRHGELVMRYGQVYGKPVEIAELPPHVVQAFLATEDRNFYHHLGVNPVAVTRALIVNMRSGAVRQGGSTITQQLAKNVFLTPERTLHRKVQEMLLSLQLEAAYTKDEILALYLNNVYFGAGTYGLRAAADRYFAKAPAQLSVGEAAMLAGLLKAPSRYSPASNPAAARARAHTVLEAMFDAGYLSREKADALIAGQVARISQRRNPAPYAADYVVEELRDAVGKMAEDVTIHTTLDLEAHRRATAAMARLPAHDTRFKEDIQVAMLALEADGAIRLLIGGRNYEESQYNRATQARRQPGSAFKPFVYLAALEDGRQPDDIILDTPIELGGWTPANYKGKYYGAVNLTEALGRSLNAAAIRLQEETGRGRVLEVARRLGFTGEIDPGAALALGVNETTPLELAGTYLPFANQGVASKPYIISSIYGARGQVLYARQSVPPAQVIAPEDVIAMNHMLRQVVTNGSGGAAALPGYATAGKTGTTQDSRDAWFAGHAAGLVGVVWLGKDDFTPMTQGWSPVSGSGTPALLWRDMMLETLNGRPDTPVTPWTPRRKELPSIFDHFRNLLTSKEESAEEGVEVIYRAATPRDELVSKQMDPLLEEVIETTRPAPVVTAPAPSDEAPTAMDALLSDVMSREESGQPDVSELERLLEDELAAQQENRGATQAALLTQTGADGAAEAAPIP